jgi:hypothetical protein
MDGTPNASLRKTALALGAIPVVLLLTLFLTGRFTVWDEALSLSDAWNRGLIQGFVFLNIALFPIAFGVSRARPWARWGALVWFPALLINNVLVDLWHLQSVRGDTILIGVSIAAFWVWAAYRQLFNHEVSPLFTGKADV